MKNSRFMITIIVLLLGAGLNYYLSRPDITLPRKSLSDFPRTLGDWTVVSDHQIDEKAMKILQVDDYIVRNYRNSNGEIVNLYIGYWKSQREGKGIHSPRQCLPGSGWLPIDTCIYQFPVSTLDIQNLKMSSPSNSTLTIQNSRFNGSKISVNKFVMGKGLDRQLYLFWYHGRGRFYASEYWNKVYLIWDGMTRKRTDGSLVRVSNSVIGNGDEALKKQSEFIYLFLPLLKEYIPE